MKNMWFLFKKNSEQASKDTPDAITRLQDGLFVSFRQISFVFSGVLFAGFLCFITGYFFGKKAGFEQFTSDIMHESLSDKMYASFCALCDQPESVAITDEVNKQETEQNVLSKIAEPAVPYSALTAQNEISTLDQNLIREMVPLQKEKAMQYRANLVGFSTRRAAQIFVKKVKMRQGISLHIKERHSKNSRGKNVPWYQVVTDTYATRDDIATLLSRIQKVAPLKDVKIVEIA